MTLEEVKEQEAIAEKAYRKVRETRERLEQEERGVALNDLKPVAAYAHKLLCPYNHTDGCSWGYEEKGGTAAWTGQYSAHAKWLEKIEKLVSGLESARVPLSEITAVLDSLAEAKTACRRYSYVLAVLR